MIPIDPKVIPAGQVLKHDAHGNPTPINDFPSLAGRFSSETFSGTWLIDWKWLSNFPELVI